MAPTKCFPASGFPGRVLLCALITSLICLFVPWAVAEDTATGPQQVTGPQQTVGEPIPATPDEQLPRVRIDPEGLTPDELAKQLLAAMTLEEKIGQMCQTFPYGDPLAEEVGRMVRAGQVGSMFYTDNEETVRVAQKIAVEESRLGIPLIVARDVIHGFRTIFPIPLGQAASWNPKLVERAARVSADEARRVGIHWSFAPMVDITRDPRWGRIAESPGEDPFLAGAVGAAMVRGFQSPDSDGVLQGVAACPKHFVAYGLSEGGRDYNRVMVSRNELRNVFLAPFKACVDAGADSLMTAFVTVNGVPATAHEHLVRRVLKDEWQFPGMVVSDWGTVDELLDHGYAPDEKQAALSALRAGLDMEMVSTCYRDNLPQLVRSGKVSEQLIDDAVVRILRAKAQLGLFSKPYADRGRAELLAEDHLRTARELARQSAVLLKNEGTLPLDPSGLKRVAVIGPLADAAKDQLGTWVLDARPDDGVTPVAALADALGSQTVITYVSCEESMYDAGFHAFDAAVAAAQNADVALLFVGEPESLSGEAHCRTDLRLPGSQAALVAALAELDTPLVTVVMAGRPLTIGPQVEQSDAVLYAWQPGTMAGPALVDLLLGVETPSGKLPVTFPKNVGQVPLYYNHPHLGRPCPADYQPPSLDAVDDLNEDNRFASHYIDSDPFPLFPFGYGLSYTDFEYDQLEVSPQALPEGDPLTVSVRLSNTGDREATEVVQLYVRDMVASIVRPVKELKAFRRITLKPGESRRVRFELPRESLGFYNEDERFVVEPGQFQVWVGGSSEAELSADFSVR